MMSFRVYFLAETKERPGMSPMDPKRDFFRHTLATLAYRGGKAVRHAPAEFAEFEGGGRRPAQPLTWDKETCRFFSALQRFDDYLASEGPVHAPIEKLFQGPIADALTHVGQIAMLRRMAGAPTSGENYFVADMAVGRVGAEQAAPKKEF